MSKNLPMKYQNRIIMEKETLLVDSVRISVDSMENRKLISISKCNTVQGSLLISIFLTLFWNLKRDLFT